MNAVPVLFLPIRSNDINDIKIGNISVAHVLLIC